MPKELVRKTGGSAVPLIGDVEHQLFVYALYRIPLHRPQVYEFYQCHQTFQLAQLPHKRECIHRPGYTKPRPEPGQDFIVVGCTL